MRLLLTVLTDSLIIWTRNFTLVYIFLFSLFLLGAILPEGVLPAWEWRWLLLFAVVLLVMAAIAAGWFSMVASACTRFLGRPREEALRDVSPLAAFSLYKEFFPGIARFFPSIAGGMLIHGVAILLLFNVIHPMWTENQAILEKLIQADLSHRETAIQSLSFAEQVNLGKLSLVLLVGMFAYIGFLLIFMLWPALVVYYGDGTLKAFWRASLQYFKDPLRMFPLSGLFLLTGTSLYFMTALSAIAGPLVLIMFQLFLLLMLVYMVIAVFVYVYHAVGKPVEQPAEKPDSDTVGQPPAV